MTSSFIAIKGNFLEQAEEIFTVFNYIDTDEDRQFVDWDHFNHYLLNNYATLECSGTIVRGIWTDNQWTIINDPEMVDATDKNALEKLSQKLNTEVYTFILQTGSKSFGFAAYQQTLKRNLLVSLGLVVENLHPPLEQEKEMDVSKGIFADDILNLAERMGINLKGKGLRLYTAKHLTYTQQMRNELDSLIQQQAIHKDKRYWWKFWS